MVPAMDKQASRGYRRGLKVAGALALSSLGAAAALSVLMGKSATAQLQPPDAGPANPDATEEAQELLRRINWISGSFTLTGQQNFPEDRSRCSDRVCELTGRFPAIFGQDFGFMDYAGGRAAMIEEVKRQHCDGAVIALTWHAARPNEETPRAYEESVQGSLTDPEWSELLTPDTDIHNRWARQVDEIAGYLRVLLDAGVPVLFRPYHEMNAQWFWWGGRAGERGSAALYRQLYERYVHLHRLNNLVWVWNVNSPSEYAGPIGSYDPGPEYVDVVTMDNYGRFRRKFYEDMLALAGNKPIALAEVGAMPTLEVLARQPRWAYFMIWRGFETKGNSPEQLQAMFRAKNLLSRGDARFSAPATSAEIAQDKSG